MSKIIIGTTSFEVVLPFHLDVLELAAEAIDRSNVAVAEMARLQNADERIPLPLLVKALGASVEALHVAIQHKNPKVTLDEVRRLVTLSDVWSVSQALNAALSASGLEPKGEGTARPTAPSPRRSKSKSGASSRTSPRPKSAAETGTA